jgi:hypothetical protein
MHNTTHPPLNALFESIRSEDVVLWLGAGFSRYAGYPTGNELANKMFERLPEAYQVNKLRDNLQEVSQAFESLNKRQGLLDFIQKCFPNSSLENKHHAALVRIPQLKTIVTTNFDSLIEDAYGNFGQVIMTDQQATNIERTKTQILKIHGDFVFHEKLIITKKDYVKFLHKNDKNLWNLLRERITTKVQLFLGYGFDDPNVEFLFEEAWTSIDDVRKASYLVAPYLDPHRQDYLRDKRITFIEMNAETFIELLTKNIIDNINDDFRAKRISADTLMAFYNRRDLLPTIKTDGNSYQIVSVEGISGRLRGSFKIDVPRDSDVAKKFDDLIQGKSFEPVEIGSHNTNHIDWRVEDIRMDNGSADRYLKIIRPPKRFDADVRFKRGNEFNSIPIKLYGSPHLIEIHADLGVGTLLIKIKNPVRSPARPTYDLSFNVIANDIIPNVTDAIRYHKFLEQFYSGEEFTIFSPIGKTKRSVPTHTLKGLEEGIKSLRANIKYFEMLKEVERFYGLKFENVSWDDINQESGDALEEIVDSLDEAVITRHFTTPVTTTFVSIADKQIEKLEKLNAKPETLTIQMRVPTIFKVHGEDINIGFKRIDFLNVHVVNLDQVKKRKTKKVQFDSSDRVQLVKYLKELPPEDRDNN